LSGISRIGSNGSVSRDTPSTGHDAIEAREKFKMLEAQGSSAKRNPKVDQVAKLYEKQFLGEMLKAMRSTVSFSDATKPTMAENIYRDQLDEQYIEAWGDQGGIGLSDLIYDQIMDRYFNQGGGRDLKQQGPITLSDRDVTRVLRVRPSQGESAKPNEVPLRVEVSSSDSRSATQVKAPWDGEIVLASKVDGKSAVTMRHPTGLRSTLIFDGVLASEVRPGQSLEKGGTVGILSPEIHSFFWNLKTPSDTQAGSLIR
jgi:flagellar protein FlgJ